MIGSVEDETTYVLKCFLIVYFNSHSYKRFRENTSVSKFLDKLNGLEVSQLEKYTNLSGGQFFDIALQNQFSKIYLALAE